MNKDELYSLEAFDFLERVEGALLWHEYQLDETLNNFAWYTANQMLASGNMKKGTDALKLKKDLYRSIEDMAEESATDNKPKDAKAERARLMERFNL